jgi:glycosyltransferase involved in cell wall biosynthesis
MAETSDRMLSGAKKAWRKVAPANLRPAAQPVAAWLAERKVQQALRVLEPPQQPGPLLVSGLIAETRGISEAARLTIAGLKAAGYAPVAHDLRPVFEAGPGARARLPVDRPGGVWLLHVNAPEALHALAYVDPDQWRGRRRIGFWAYELQRVPGSWVRAAQGLHEIWAPSKFVADAIVASGVRIPVRVMPHPVALTHQVVTPDRKRFGIDANAAAVLAMGDLASSAERKNLAGAIAIYRQAFPEADGRTRLIIKTHGNVGEEVFQRAAQRAAGGREDVQVIAERLTDAEMKSLIASSDVLLSPHRSEGYGIPLAEAFLMGIPALATNWSGNMDFMADIPELLIKSTLVPVRDPYGVYKLRNQLWAEPDIADAANKLRALAANPLARQRLALQGRQAVDRQAQSWTRQRIEATSFAGLAG